MITHALTPGLTQESVAENRSIYVSLLDKTMWRFLKRKDIESGFVLYINSVRSGNKQPQVP